MVMAVVGVLAAACSGKPAPRAAGAPEASSPPISFAVTAPGTPDDVRSAVTAGLDRWLAQAVLEPLRTGRPAAGLEAVFTLPAVARMAGADRNALTGEGLPAASAVRADGASATLTPLSAPGEGIALVSARVDLRLRGTVPGGELTIAQQGDLVLLPDSGGWKIDGYALTATRDAAGHSTTTAATRP